MLLKGGLESRKFKPCPNPIITPYYGLFGDAGPEREYLFRLQVYGKVGNTVVEEYERVGKSVISVCKKSQKGLTREIYGCDKVERAVRFCDLFIC